MILQSNQSIDTPAGMSPGPAPQIALRPIATAPASRSLRLIAPEGSLDRLRDAPIIARHARNRGVVRRLHAIYYDTRDRSLFAGGLSLRVQRHGSRFLQTLRQHGSGQGGPANALGGLAWRSPVADLDPDLGCLAGADVLPLSAALFERLRTSPLAAVFETERRRQVRQLAFPTAAVTLAIDEGVIEAAAGCQDFAEIRLLLQDGDAGMLYEIGMRLLELAPVRVNYAGTVRRGYALASGTAPMAEKAAASGLARDFVVDDMIASVLEGCRLHLHANQAAAEGGGAEGVHQMRVALRRLRTALSLLRRELPSATMDGLGVEAKWLADGLGAARAWDVFVSSTLAGPSSLDAAGVDFDALRQAAENPRQAGHASARVAIASVRAQQFELLLGQWIARRGWRNEASRDGLAVLAEPASAMAGRVLARLHNKARREGRDLGRLSATERHALRITLKKLRYAAEFFLPLAAQKRAGSRFLSRLAKLQDVLGLDHDAATTQPLLDQIEQQRQDQPGDAGGSSGLHQAPALHQAIGVVIGWQGREVLATREVLAERWRRFRALPPFWTDSATRL